MKSTRPGTVGMALALLGTLATAGTAASLQQAKVTTGKEVERDRDGVVTGVVLSQRTGEPVAGARVVMDDGSETETSPSGRFAFTSSEPGTRQIAAMVRGCRTAAGTFEVQAGHAARLELHLEGPAPLDGARERTRSGEKIDVIGGERLEELAHLSLLQVLRRETTGMLGSSLGHRGSRSDGPPLLLLNDTRVTFDVAEVLAGIRAADAVRVEVVPGSSATTEYGPRAAYGLIRVFVRDGPDQVDPGTPASQCRVRWGSF